MVEKKHKKSITWELLIMEIGDRKPFPITNLASVRSIASTMGTQWERKYSTRQDKGNRVVNVTRIE